MSTPTLQKHLLKIIHDVLPSDQAQYAYSSLSSESSRIGHTEHSLSDVFNTQQGRLFWKQLTELSTIMRSFSHSELTDC